MAKKRRVDPAGPRPRYERVRNVVEHLRAPGTRARGTCALIITDNWLLIVPDDPNRWATLVAQGAPHPGSVGGRQGAEVFLSQQLIDELTSDPYNIPLAVSDLKKVLVVPRGRRHLRRDSPAYRIEIHNRGSAGKPVVTVLAGPRVCDFLPDFEPGADLDGMADGMASTVEEVLGEPLGRLLVKSAVLAKRSRG